MFRSPRFLVGFILFMAVVCYAIFFPLVNTADPKADRRANPFYEETMDLRAAIEAKDSDAVYAELDKLDAIVEEPADQEVLDEVRAAMDAGGLTNAAKGAKQIKKTKNPIAYAEFANLRDYLGATKDVEPDVDKAREEMTALMGGTNARLEFTGNPPTVIMLIGLQGAGKTTLAGKLAGMLQKQGKKPMLVAADVYRPAASKQLQVV